MTIAWDNAVWCVLVTQHSLNLVLASSLTQDVPFKNASFTNETTLGLELFSSSTASRFSGSSHVARQSTSSTTAQKLGDLIAQGLGMSTTTESLPSDGNTATISSSSSAPLTRTSHSLSQATGTPSTGQLQQNESVASGLLTRPASIGTLSQAIAINSSASATGFIPSEESTTWPNRSLTLSGDCWNQWSQYWSAQDWPTQRWTSNSYTTETYTTTLVPVSMYTSVFLSFYTTTVFGGRFPLTTYSTLAPVSEYEWSTGTPSTTSTGTRTWNPGFSEGAMPSVSLPTPLCVLPSSVSQCQKSWDDWVDWTTAGERAATFDPFEGPPGCNPTATTTIPLSCKAPLSTWEVERSSYYAKGDVPRCSQAKLNDDYCSQARSIFISRGEKKGYYFDDARYTATTIDGLSTDVMIWPSNTTIAGPVCTLGCGNCALQGQTVELIYWPPATVLSNSTNHTATHSPTGPVTFETFGTTLTSPTVCISFDTLWAKNSCSRFGRSISSTIVAITNTQDMSSLYGFGLHMDGRQMSASFNFNDLYQDPVPQEIYESQPRCWRSSRAAQGGRYRPLPSDYPGCARTLPYEPIIVIPAEVRDLDPEWANCKGGIEGVYDPPVALRQTDSIVVPTQPGVHTTTSPAAPASTPTSDSAPQTPSDTSPSPRPTSASKLPDHDPIEDQPPKSPVDPPVKPSEIAKADSNNVWPLPVTDLGDDDDDPITTNALSVLKSAQASAAAAQAASHGSGASGHDGSGQQGENSHTGSGSPDGTIGGEYPNVADQEEENTQAGDSWPDGTPSAEDPNKPRAQDETGTSGGRHSDDTRPAGTQTADGSNDPEGHTTDASLHPKQASAVWTHDGESYTAVVGRKSAVIHGAGTATTIAAGTRQTFQGQVFSVPLGGNAIKADDTTLELKPLDGVTNDNDSTGEGSMVFNEAGEAITAELIGSSMILQADGSATTMAPGAAGVFAGQTVSVPRSGSNVVNVGGKSVTMQALMGDGTIRLPASAVWTHGGQTFTAKMQSDATVLLAGPSTTVHVAAGSSVTLGNEVISVLPTGGVLVHDGALVTLSRAAAPTDPAGAITTLGHNGEFISAFDSGNSIILIVGDRSITLADSAQTRLGDEVFSAAATGGVLVVNGTATLSLPTTASATNSARTTSSQVTEQRTGISTTGSSAPNNSPANAASRPIMTILAFLGLACVMRM